MLKFTGESKDGRRVYFLGVSRANVERLTHDQPIVVNLAEMGGPEAQVVIVFGETEQLLLRDLQRIGAIGPEVVFREAKPGVVEVVRIRRAADGKGGAS